MLLLLSHISRVQLCAIPQMAGSSVPGILQARILEWVAIAFSNRRMLSGFSRVWLCEPHGQQPTRLPCSWDSPGKNTGVGCHCLLQSVMQVFKIFASNVPFSQKVSKLHVPSKLKGKKEEKFRNWTSEKVETYSQNNNPGRCSVSSHIKVLENQSGVKP